MSNKKNEVFEGIFKPYLVHVEFEVLNIMTQLKVNKQLREFLSQKGYNTNSLENIIGIFLSRIRQLIAIMRRD